MLERVMETAKGLRQVSGGEEAFLELLCRAACRRIDSRLRPGVLPEECSEAYVAAAVWLALDGLDCGSGGISRFSAGDVSIEKGGGEQGGLEQRAWALLRPYLRDDSFEFRRI